MFEFKYLCLKYFFLALPHHEPIVYTLTHASPPRSDASITHARSHTRTHSTHVCRKRPVCVWVRGETKTKARERRRPAGSSSRGRGGNLKGIKSGS